MLNPYAVLFFILVSPDGRVTDTAVETLCRRRIKRNNTLNIHLIQLLTKSKDCVELLRQGRKRVFRDLDARKFRNLCGCRRINRHIGSPSFVCPRLPLGASPCKHMATINLNHPRQHDRVQNMPQKMGPHRVHMAKWLIRPTRPHRGQQNAHTNRQPTRNIGQFALQQIGVNQD